jgi:tryptophan 2,3-dioxygenase
MSDEQENPNKPDLTDDEGNPLAYGSYLKVPELLDLQALRSEPQAHDELLFIIIHQAYELWFKLVLFELDSVGEHMREGDVYEASRLMQRVLTIEDLLVKQIHVLETMTPRDFLSFRAALKPASGFQSAQFREVEFLSGMKEGGQVMKSMQMLDDEKERLQERLDEPSLRMMFYELLADEGYDVVVPQDGEPLDEDDRKQTLDALHEIFAAPENHFHIYQLAESLVAHDQNILLWRFHHVRVVERLIGTKHGTGGSPGVKYLNSTLSKRAYPMLWEVRGMLSDEAFYGVERGPTMPPRSE